VAKLIDLAKKLRPLIEKAMQSLDDSDALEAVTLYPEWKPKEHYIKGYRVKFNGFLYTVLQNHESHETWTPDVTSSLFAKVLIPDANAIPEWEQPDSTNPYMIGDTVKHNGFEWVSDVDNNVWEPGVYGWTKKGVAV
jgi:hypothetical protein